MLSHKTGADTEDIPRCGEGIHTTARWHAHSASVSCWQVRVHRSMILSIAMNTRGQCTYMFEVKELVRSPCYFRLSSVNEPDKTIHPQTIRHVYEFYTTAVE